MNVEMENTLATFFTFVDNSAVARFSQTFLFSYFCSDNHQVSQKLFMSLFSLGYTGETISVFWYDQEMYLCNWCYVTKCEALFIFVNDGCWDLFFDNLIEDSDFFSLCCLGLCLLTLHIFHLLKLNRN